VNGFLSSDKVKGAVILTFGAGNGPDKNQGVMDAFKAANKRGVLMLNVTQCLKGEVEAAYATGTVNKISSVSRHLSA
jgi:L-asparaginase